MLTPDRPEPDALVSVAEGIELATWFDGPDLGSGAVPFVLVHGLASNAHLYDGVAATLAAAGHPVASIDLRGHGRSSKPDGPDDYTLEAVAHDVTAFVRSTIPGPCILVGQSYGAAVVLRAALDLGERVHAIGCIDGGHIDLARRFPEWETCERLLAPPRSAGRDAAEVEQYLRSAHADWPQAGFAGSLACFEVRDDGTVAPWLTYERHLRVLHGLWSGDLRTIRAGTRHPVLLLTADEGARSEMKREDVLLAEVELPDAEVVWLAGDHDLHAQHPDAVADLLRGLLERT